jgi:integrase
MAAEAKRPAMNRPAFSVNELCVRFLTQYATRYKTEDGKPSAEVDCFKAAMAHVRKLFGAISVNDFGPLRMLAVRQSMVDAGWSRRWINKQVCRVRLIFKLGVSWEMVRVDVFHALKTLPPLTIGETSAPEPEPRMAVSESDLNAVRNVLTELHRDIFDLMLLCGSRPAELIYLTTGMINRNGEIWRVDLVHHKNAKKGKPRTLFFNSAAQLILRKYLQPNPDARLFSIERNTFGNAINRACIKAAVKPFVPHQLRHTVATRLADEVGLEGAQRLLGHSERVMTESYARAAEKQAIAAVRKLG